MTQTKFHLFAAFWTVLIVCQFYFLYRKFDAVNVCTVQQQKTDAMATELDQADAAIRNRAPK